MLNYLDIRDLAVIQAVELELAAGMTVLTGETGAGKSILIGALGLVLGERASGNPVRAGAKKAEVTASFDIAALPGVCAWLATHELAGDEVECVIRRTISADGRSRAFINGQLVTLQDLKALGEMLVDIHGQHAHQSLLRRATQLDILDTFADNGSQLAELAAVVDELHQIEAELDSLGGSHEERAAEMELLAYQHNELQQLTVSSGEYEALSEEHKRLAHAESLSSTVEHAAFELLDREPLATVTLLESLAVELGEKSHIDKALGDLSARLDGIAIDLRDTAEALRDYRDHVEIDPERFAWLDQRIAEIIQLARKHRIEPSALPKFADTLAQRLQDLTEGDARVAELSSLRDQVITRYERIAAKLSARREGAAAKLSAAVATHLADLGMARATLEIRVTPGERVTPSAQGTDRVDFLFSANPGQAPQALHKVASGGELSRVSLAIQVVASADSMAPVMVFDEVDVGVGGGIAEVIGRLLAGLGRERQVLCITHQPQVAALGQAHLVVSKSMTADATETAVQVLAENQRVEELARMLGGLEITAQTRAHAKELLENQ